MAIQQNKVHNVIQFTSSRKDWKQYSLQHSMKNILIVAQFFAILPVNGITKDVKHLEFKWITMKTVYVVVTMILLTIYIVFVIFYFFYEGYENFFSFGEYLLSYLQCLIILKTI